MSGRSHKRRRLTQLLNLDLFTLILRSNQVLGYQEHDLNETMELQPLHPMTTPGTM